MSVNDLQEAYANKLALSKNQSWQETRPFATIHQMVRHSATHHGDRPALTFQLTSNPKGRFGALSQPGQTRDRWVFASQKQ